MSVDLDCLVHSLCLLKSIFMINPSFLKDELTSMVYEIIWLFPHAFKFMDFLVCMIKF